MAYLTFVLMWAFIGAVEPLPDFGVDKVYKRNIIFELALK